MTYKKIFDLFSTYTRIQNTEKEYFKKNSSIEFYQKGQTILEVDQYCNFILFINKGFGRYFYINPDGTQSTANFFSEGDFVTDYDSFFNDKKSDGYIEALTDIEAIKMPENVLNWFFSEIENSEKFRLDITNTYFAIWSKRVEGLFQKDKLSIYKDLLVQYPDIGQTVSQKIIASYLNISPVHLSRIKAQAYNKEN